ncbi:putative apyrase 6 [Hordeum vulgare]|nr:putative apyrase 6 [Hordeum vulgare]
MHRNKARVEPRAQALEQTLIPPPPPAAASKMVAQRQRSSSRSSRRHLAGAVVFLATTAFALLFLPRSSPLSYGIVIDAGSTGSRVHVIAYHAGALTQLDWSRTYSLKATPGLSSFAADPGSGGLSIAPLLEFARRHVPRDSWVHTEVRLMATAGLRLLDIATAEAVMESCRELLRGSGFRFQDQWATIISGADEGIYAWVAANYALGTLGGARQDTTGIIELGGASIQVTFATDKPMPQEFSHVLKFGDITYNLYSHSFLHLGQNVAYESLHDLLSTPALESMSTHLIHQATYKDPCTPKGFSRMVGLVKPLASVLESKNIIAHAVGNFSECRSVVRTLLHKGQGYFFRAPQLALPIQSRASPLLFLRGRIWLLSRLPSQSSPSCSLTPVASAPPCLAVSRCLISRRWSRTRRPRSRRSPASDLAAVAPHQIRSRRLTPWILSPPQSAQIEAAPDADADPVLFQIEAAPHQVRFAFLT